MWEYSKTSENANQLKNKSFEKHAEASRITLVVESVEQAEKQQEYKWYWDNADGEWSWRKKRAYNPGGGSSDEWSQWQQGGSLG